MEKCLQKHFPQKLSFSPQVPISIEMDYHCMSMPVRKESLVLVNQRSLVNESFDMWRFDGMKQKKRKQVRGKNMILMCHALKLTMHRQLLGVGQWQQWSQGAAMPPRAGDVCALSTRSLWGHKAERVAPPKVGRAAKPAATTYGCHNSFAPMLECTWCLAHSLVPQSMIKLITLNF